MEKEKSSPYTFFILRYRLVNLQGGIFAFEKEKNYGRRKNSKTKSTGNHRQAGGNITVVNANTSLIEIALYIIISFILEYFLLQCVYYVSDNFLLEPGV